jgi:hypothetical protein
MEERDEARGPFFGGDRLRPTFGGARLPNDWNLLTKPSDWSGLGVRPVLTAAEPGAWCCTFHSVALLEAYNLSSLCYNLRCDPKEDTPPKESLKMTAPQP